MHKKIIGSVSKSLSVSILIGIIGFIGSILLARLLTVEERGIYGILITIISLSAIISTISIDQSLIVAVKKKISLNVLLLPFKILPISLVLYIVIFFILVQLFNLKNFLELSLLLLFFSIAYSLFNFLSVTLGSLILKIDYNLWNKFRLSPHILFLLFLLFAYQNLTAEKAFVFFVTSTIITFFYLVFLLNKKKHLLKKNKNKLNPKKLLINSLSYHSNSTIRILSERLDQIFLITFFSPKVLAFYLIGSAIPKSMIILIQSVENLLILKFSRIKKLYIKQVICILPVINFLLLIFFGFLFFYISDSLIATVYGSAYFQSSMVLFILILSVPFYLTRLITTSIFKSFQFYKLIFVNDIIYLIVFLTILLYSNIENNWMYIPIAYTLSQLIASLSGIIMLISKFNLTFSDIFSMKNYKIKFIKLLL